MQAMLGKIKTEPLPRAILVHGSETVLQNQVYEALKERIASGPTAEWNWSVLQGSKEFDPEPLFVDLGTVPWGGTTKVVVLRRADLVPAAVMDTIATWLQEHTQANCLAVFVQNLDNRLKYVRKLREFAWEIECEPLRGERLIRYILDYCAQQGKKMRRSAAQALVERVGTDVMLALNELDKLLAWSEDRREITEEDVQAVSSLGPGQVVNETVFKMVDFIAQKKREEALSVLALLLSTGEAPLRILPLIERQLRLLLAAKTSKVRPEETARRMGETSVFPLRKQLRNADKFTVDELFDGFKAVVKADQELKLGVPGEHVLVDLIIKLT